MFFIFHSVAVFLIDRITKLSWFELFSRHSTAATNCPCFTSPQELSGTKIKIQTYQPQINTVRLAKWSIWLTPIVFLIPFVSRWFLPQHYTSEIWLLFIPEHQQWELNLLFCLAHKLQEESLSAQTRVFSLQNYPNTCLWNKCAHYTNS